MARGKAWLRHHRERVICKRVRIRRDNGWGLPFTVTNPEEKQRRWNIPGRYAKWNLVCSCGMCVMGKRSCKRKDRHDAKLKIQNEVE